MAGGQLPLIGDNLTQRIIDQGIDSHVSLIP